MDYQVIVNNFVFLIAQGFLGIGAFTGGTYAYVSPGLRWSGRRGSVYALIQLPVYQDVNGLQLTSRRNWVTGVQKRF